MVMVEVMPEDCDEEEEDVDEHQHEDREVEEEEGLVTGVADKTRLPPDSSLEINPYEKSRIRETPNFSTDADSSTDKILRDYVK